MLAEPERRTPDCDGRGHAREVSLDPEGDLDPGECCEVITSIPASSIGHFNTIERFGDPWEVLHCSPSARAQSKVC